MRRLIHISPAAIKDGPEGFTAWGKADREWELVEFRLDEDTVAALRAVPAAVSGVYVEESDVIGVTPMTEPDYDSMDYIEVDEP